LVSKASGLSAGAQRQAACRVLFASEPVRLARFGLSRRPGWRLFKHLPPQLDTKQKCEFRYGYG